jgi:hypothetical protein
MYIKQFLAFVKRKEIAEKFMSFNFFLSAIEMREKRSKQSGGV